MISTLKGDITGLDFDLIVNAANTHLQPGSGVCGAIFAKAGKALEKECQKIGYCPTGQAVLTKAYNLPCKGIIHTVGPIYHGSKEDVHNLEACYWNSLALAYDYGRQHNCEQLTIGFPCISTGVYGYPHDEACQIAVRTVRRLMREYPEAGFIHVVFVCYLEQDYMLYKKELSQDALYSRNQP